MFPLEVVVIPNVQQRDAASETVTFLMQIGGLYVYLVLIMYLLLVRYLLFHHLFKLLILSTEEVPFPMQLEKYNKR